MTQRERQASGGASATIPTLPAGPSRPGSPADAARLLPWEELFHITSAAQRGELLALAERQGLLYAHQLPAPSNGARAAAHEADAGTRQVLGAFLNGQVGHLRPSAGPAPAPVDADLCPRQRDAVARALNTPDLCLIQGLPGTGKSRVVAEIVSQAALRGERVLLLASGSAALDAVLERAGRREAVCAVRCLGKDETAEMLAPEVRPFLFAERLRALGEQGTAAAQGMAEQAEARCRLRRQEESAWPQLRECVGEHHLLESRLAELGVERARADAVAAEADRCDADASPRGETAFARSLRDCRAKRDAALAELGQVRAVAEAKRVEKVKDAAQVGEQVERLRPLVAAKERGRWWSSNFWRATFRGDVAASFAEVEKRHQEAQAAAGDSEAEVRLLDEKCRQTEDVYRQQRERIVAQETARRQKQCAACEDELRGQQGTLLGRWEKAKQRLKDASPPARCDETALDEAYQSWQRLCTRDQEQLALARGWLAHLRETASSWPARLRRLTNLVASTTAALAADEHFGDAAASEIGFDLLVLEEADQVTESEFLKAARRARRWILVAEQTVEPALDALPPPDPAMKKPGRTPHHLAPLRSGCFPRLWQHLHCDPSRLPYSWFEEAGRLFCRLIPLTAEQRRRLECESVVDRPEIELRILTLPDNRPLLAEVAFPASFTIQQAKEYIYRELQELPIQTLGRCLRWEEAPGALVLRLADAPPRDAAPAILEAGVHEWVGRDAPVRQAAAPWLTCRVEFLAEAGWSRERAEEWIHHRLRLRDLGRTARLEAPWRMRPELAAVVWDLLYQAPPPDFALPAELAGMAALAPRPAVEFVAVPSPPRERRPRDRAAPATRGDKSPGLVLPRHGAGLELDLAGGRHDDLLPDDLRQGLSPRGLVNYLEAQAVVRALEEMAGDAVLCATLARAPGARATQVAVLSPSAAQVELIRRLIGHSAVLARGPLAIEVNVPAAFRHRECYIGLVSLTRSHSHRAVTWADSPQTLALALTRARWQLVFFGDPGTLARRAGWRGPVDHLDEAAAERERQLLAGLVGYLQGQGAHSKAFHLREGNGA